MRRCSRPCARPAGGRRNRLQHLRSKGQTAPWRSPRARRSSSRRRQGDADRVYAGGFAQCVEVALDAASPPSLVRPWKSTATFVPVRRGNRGAAAGAKDDLSGKEIRPILLVAALDWGMVISLAEFPSGLPQCGSPATPGAELPSHFRMLVRQSLATHSGTDDQDFKLTPVSKAAFGGSTGEIARRRRADAIRVRAAQTRYQRWRFARPRSTNSACAKQASRARRSTSSARPGRCASQAAASDASSSRSRQRACRSCSSAGAARAGTVPWRSQDRVPRRGHWPPRRAP